MKLKVASVCSSFCKRAIARGFGPPSGDKFSRRKNADDADQTAIRAICS